MKQTIPLPASRILPLEGVLNARELGGLPLKNGHRVRPGQLIRSGRLSDLTKKDHEILETHWHVTDIADLRDEQEVWGHPDRKLNGAALHRLPIFSGTAAGISRSDQSDDSGTAAVEIAIRRAQLLGPDGAKRLLEQIYTDMVSQTYCLDRLRDFFQLLLSHGKGTFLWHCTSGKDRTGLCCALLLWALGATWDTIFEDYLFTNRQTHAYREALCADMKRRGARTEYITQIRILESVDAAYLRGCFSIIHQSFGSMDVFMAERLGVTETAREKLRQRYVL